MQLILRSTARGRRSIWTISSPSRFGAHVLLHNISMVNKGIVVRKICYFRTSVTMTLIGYTMQSITKTKIVLTHTAGIRPLSKLFTCYLIFSSVINVFEILPTRESSFAQKVLADTFGEGLTLLREKEEEEDEMWNRSATISEALRNVTYLCQKHIETP